MNSLFKEESQQQNREKTSFIPEVATFTINPPNTTLHIHRSIHLLTSIEHQNLIDYRRDFYEIKASCRCDDATANDVLISLTSTKLLPYYTGQNTLEDKLNSLLSVKYPASDSLKYYTELSTLRQCDFVTTAKYKERIEEICLKLGNCKRWNHEIIVHKTEECFYNGLSRRTQLEMSRLNIKSLVRNVPNF